MKRHHRQLRTRLDNQLTAGINNPSFSKLIQDAEEPTENNEQSEYEADLQPPMVDDNEPTQQCDNSLIQSVQDISEEQLGCSNRHMLVLVAVNTGTSVQV